MARFELEALIVVDAADEEEARTKARAMSERINAEDGPGAFFFGIGVAPLHDAEEIDINHEAARLALLPVPRHVREIAGQR